MDSAKEQSGLLTPEEAAQLMSVRAGYKITTDDIKQLRHSGKIKAAKQLSRTTLYERKEIEGAPLPKKHNVGIINNVKDSLSLKADENVSSTGNSVATASFSTWRELLAHIISDPYEKTRVIDVTKINPVTLTRWITGTSSPRPDSIRLLVSAFPQYSKQLMELISQEFPHFTALNNQVKENLLEIPSGFYSQILRTYANVSSPLRFTTICTLVLQQMVEMLDPNKIGIIVSVVLCVPPKGISKVRSLRTALSKGTRGWKSDVEPQALFFGAESEVGRAILAKHPIITESHKEKSSSSSYMPELFKEESVITYPIILADRTPGCIRISSAQPKKNLELYLDLIQSYADILLLAFEKSDFYALKDIGLEIMPPADIQRPLIEKFYEMVRQEIINAHIIGKVILRSEAELVVKQSLEDKLVYCEFKDKNKY